MSSDSTSFDSGAFDASGDFSGADAHQAGSEAQADSSAAAQETHHHDAGGIPDTVSHDEAAEQAADTDAALPAAPGIMIPEERTATGGRVPPEYALVTGASSGIGAAIARKLAARGTKLILVARSEERLVEVARGIHTDFGTDVQILISDLSDPASASTIADIIAQEGWFISTLVNNAGFGAAGEFIESSQEQEIAMINVNVSTLVALTHAFLPDMIERRRGKILNIASTAGFQPIPYLSSYAASKAFVKNFSLGLAHEVRSHGVQVCVCCPGPTRTSFFDTAKMDKSQINIPMMDADEVAEQALAALDSGRPLVVPGAMNKVSAFITRLLPTSLIVEVGGSLFKKISKI